MGQWITPLFAPMGIHQDNWPATVGLLTGMLAKEVVVGTLNSLYAQVGHVGELAAAHFDFWAGIKAALWSVPQNLAQLGSALTNPILASAADNPVSQSVYGIMAQRFDGKIGAYAYLLFVLLYIPCVSTMAVIRQEANRKYMWISVVWSFVIAYAAAVLFYQSAQWIQRSEQSVVEIIVFLLVLVVVIGLRQYTKRNMRRNNAVANT
ncbi:ferrous iron transport protein B [Legionella cherrii]|nr:ferrous iron transport protein B [Legionella cherrii]